MRINLHKPTFGEEEIEAAVDVLRTTNVTSGEKVREFESLFGPHSVMVNSGSSANLLAVAALCNPLSRNRLAPGDEVIVSALSWSTTVWPLVQYGLTPVIVDIDDGFNMDPDEMKKAIGPRTRAVMPVHVYGNPCNQEIFKIAEENNLTVIEDCCEALGADVGKSDYNTYSFYFSHHITTLEGGMITTKTTEQADMLRVLRAHGWTREMVNPVHHAGIDNKFLFINAGYNLRASEVNAAIGLVQHKKLDGFVSKRKEVATRLKTIFKDSVTQQDNGSSWFGFPVINGMREHFDKNGVETRPIICGNIARQPGMKLWPHRVIGTLKNADVIMESGYALPCHQGMTDEDCDYIEKLCQTY